MELDSTGGKQDRREMILAKTDAVSEKSGSSPDYNLYSGLLFRTFCGGLPTLGTLVGWLC